MSEVKEILKELVQKLRAENREIEERSKDNNNQETEVTFKQMWPDWGDGAEWQ
jgi:hypothetical protein